MTLVEFECRDQRFALPLDCVRRVIASAKPSLLPGAPDIILGVLNVGSDIVTVIDFSQRIGLPPAAMTVSQRLVIVDMSGFMVGCVVDSVTGVTSRDWEQTPCVPEPLAGAEFVASIVRLDDGLCIIVDPEKFLLEGEKTLLGAALERTRHESQ